MVVLRFLVLIVVADLVHNNVIIIVTAAVPAIIPWSRLLSVVELLDESSNQTLSCATALRVSTSFLEGDFVQLLHVVSLGKNLEELFLLQNILQNEGRVHDSLILTLTAELINKRGQDLLFLFCDLC